MAARRKFLLILGFGVSVFLIMLCFHQWDTEKRERIDQQEIRKQQLREECDGDQERFTDRSKLPHLLVNDEHGIIYCYISKVACTNWKRVLYVLLQNKPYPDPMSVSHYVAHHRNGISLLMNNPGPEAKEKLKHYTKFLFVRDPFVRLISAFRDKIQITSTVQEVSSQKYGQETFYQKYGRDILRRYANYPNPPQTAREAAKSGVSISFYNFIQYLLDPRTAKPFDEHWRPMHLLCSPCSIQYDFVGHQETLQQDAEQLLKILKLEDDIKFPYAYENVTTQAFVLDWFSTVPLEDRRKLYKLYEKDFKLFGYRKPVELLDG